MKENWLEDYEKKGELWICPIHTMEIIPGQTEVLSNLQISFPKSEQETMTVDAFVYFKEDRIETGANNRISISFLKKTIIIRIIQFNLNRPTLSCLCPWRPVSALIAMITTILYEFANMTK